MSTVRAPAAPVLVQDGLEEARSAARTVEGRLDPIEQKVRGQYFTSMAVARVLAALSVRPGCQDIIDPMAGHGALLDAALERASLLGLPIRHVAAIEINPTLAEACRARIAAWQEHGVAADTKVHAASAFDPQTIRRLEPAGFDLVIGNPPYVRYQSTANGRSKQAQVASDVRDGLDAIAAERAPSAERDVWRALIRAYSGLADLSVPAWLLSGLLVKPGGVLALVVPATWRSRNYADVVQYLMQRCFRLERVVADGRARWFSSVLVRTELIVATRLAPAVAALPLRRRADSSEHAAAVEITEAAASETSLVGRAFPTNDPERTFDQWLQDSNPPHRDGIHLRRTLTMRVGLGGSTSQWARDLEGVSGPDLFDPGAAATHDISIPDQLADLIPDAVELRSLSAYGIEVGQGLRTGCNEFFYVDFVEPARAGFSTVRTSSVLGGQIVEVPDEALQPVLRKQSELADFVAGRKPSGRALDLSGFVLPEDMEIVRQFRTTYALFKEQPPLSMSPQLAELVRRAATTKHGHLAAPIAELSAVRTNARPGSGKATPRFWYMLPAFVRRHRPDAFVARVNTGTPTVYVNRSRPILIDANFSTFWSAQPKRAATMIAPLLNSTWARACMEAMGTVLGGGALKLEATHLRRLPLPLPSAKDLSALSSTTDVEAVDRILFSALLGRQIATREYRKLQERIREVGERLRVQRQPH